MGLELATQWLQGKLLHPLLPNVSDSLRLRGSSRQAGRIQLWTQMFLLTYLTFSCANVVESHRSLPRSDGNPVAPIAVSHHVEPGRTDRPMQTSMTRSEPEPHRNRACFYRTLKHIQWELTFDLGGSAPLPGWVPNIPADSREALLQAFLLHQGAFNAVHDDVHHLEDPQIRTSADACSWIHAALRLTSTSRSTTSPGIFSIRMSMTRSISAFARAKVVVWTFCWDWELA